MVEFIRYLNLDKWGEILNINKWGGKWAGSCEEHFAWWHNLTFFLKYLMSSARIYLLILEINQKGRNFGFCRKFEAKNLQKDFCFWFHFSRKEIFCKKSISAKIVSFQQKWASCMVPTKLPFLSKGASFCRNCAFRQKVILSVNFCFGQKIHSKNFPLLVLAESVSVDL